MRCFKKNPKNQGVSVADVMRMLYRDH